MAKRHLHDVEEWKKNLICWHCGQNFYPDFSPPPDISDCKALHQDESSVGSQYETWRREKTPKYIYEHEYIRRKQRPAWTSWFLCGISVGLIVSLAFFINRQGEPLPKEYVLIFALCIFVPLTIATIFDFSRSWAKKKLRARVLRSSLFFPRPVLFLRYDSSHIGTRGKDFFWHTLKIPLSDVAEVKRIFFPEFLSENFPEVIFGSQRSPRLHFNKYIQSDHPVFAAPSAKQYRYILFCDLETPHEALEGVEILLYDGYRVVFETDDAENCVKILREEGSRLIDNG